VDISDELGFIGKITRISPVDFVLSIIPLKFQWAFYSSIIFKSFFTAHFVSTNPYYSSRYNECYNITIFTDCMMNILQDHTYIVYIYVNWKIFSFIMFWYRVL
jgi:hypothetical protein